MCTFFTIDKYYYVFLKCVNKDIIIELSITNPSWPSFLTDGYYSPSIVIHIDTYLMIFCQIKVAFSFIYSYHYKHFTCCCTTLKRGTNELCNKSCPKYVDQYVLK